MLPNCRMPLLVVMLCLLDSGCISVRYCDRALPLEPTPAVRPVKCGSVIEPTRPLHEAPPLREADIVCQSPPLLEPVPLPESTCLIEKPWHSRLHAALPGFWRFHRKPLPVAPLIPPRSRFHPVPTHPVFARQVIFESEPRLIPSPITTPRPEAIDSPPVYEPTGEPPLDADADQAPRTLSDELRVASPISPPSMQAR